MKITNEFITKILPYGIIAIFVIFAACMTLEIQDMNAEIEQCKKILADYKNAEIDR